MRAQRPAAFCRALRLARLISYCPSQPPTCLSCSLPRTCARPTSSARSSPHVPPEPAPPLPDTLISQPGHSSLPVSAGADASCPVLAHASLWSPPSRPSDSRPAAGLYDDPTTGWHDGTSILFSVLLVVNVRQPEPAPPAPTARRGRWGPSPAACSGAPAPNAECSPRGSLAALRFARGRTRPGACPHIGGILQRLQPVAAVRCAQRRQAQRADLCHPRHAEPGGWLKPAVHIPHTQRAGGLCCGPPAPHSPPPSL